jgi:hypothetical protein
LILVHCELLKLSFHWEHWVRCKLFCFI